MSLKDYEEIKKGADRFFQNFLTNSKEIDCVLLTGSVARGDCNLESGRYTVDICILSESFDLLNAFNNTNKERLGRFLNVEFEDKVYTIENIKTSSLFPYKSDMETKYFALQEGCVIFDSNGVWDKLCKLKKSEQERTFLLKIYFQQAIYHSNNYRVLKWKQNQSFEQCHLNFNECISLLLKILFLINDSFIPREDYLLYFSKKLAWLPKDFSNRIVEVVLIHEASLKDIRRRQKVLGELVFELKEKVELEGLLEIPTDNLLPKLQLNFR